MDRIRTWIRTARDRHVLGRALATAAVVGSTLVLINHADALALKPVDIPEFGFINVYGTDITAGKGPLATYFLVQRR